MTQNIYDDEDFFREYSRLPRSVAGLDAAPEWPALRALLPDLDGLTVVDLGCGFGWFCRWVREQGAASVLGIDASENMLARAIAATGDPAMTYTRADMEWLELPPASFDLAYSSLALHYVDRLQFTCTALCRGAGSTDFGCVPVARGGGATLMPSLRTQPAGLVKQINPPPR
jgi:ubiquinone/menaquinone biosynthesis C-methylase UbiE